MYAFLARVLPATDYDFFTYQGKKPVDLDFRGKPVSISKGTKFGVRPSTNGKSIRLIFPDAPTKVHTITLDQAKALAKGVAKD